MLSYHPYPNSIMKKTSHSSTSKKAASTSHSRKGIAPLENPLTDNPADEPDLAAEQFAVVARGDEAASSGHRVEPIQPDEEGNAETLIEEGLHGYLHISSKKSRNAK